MMNIEMAKKHLEFLKLFDSNNERAVQERHRLNLDWEDLFWSVEEIVESLEWLIKEYERAN